MAEQTQQPTRRAWTGNSKHALESSAMLGGKWWQVGDKIACIFQRDFTTRHGLGREFMLVQPQVLTVFVDEWGSTYRQQPNETTKGADKQITRFALPPLQGFESALHDLQAAAPGFGDLRFGDHCLITCFAIKPSDDPNQSDSPQFELSVDPR
jgi:hypothetical protein